MVRRPGHHGVRDFLGQPRQEPGKQNLRRLYERRPIGGDGRHRAGHRRTESAHHGLLRRRHPARLDAGVAGREAAGKGGRAALSSPPRGFHPPPPPPPCPPPHPPPPPPP